MKNIIIIILTLFSFTSVNANNMDQDKKHVLVEELFQATDMYNMIPSLVKSVIIRYKKQATHIPQSYWDTIEKSVDYGLFIAKSKQIYLDNYTIAELEELLELYQSKDLNSYKQKSKKIEQELYALGNKFGKQAAQDIATKVRNYRG